MAMNVHTVLGPIPLQWEPFIEDSIYQAVIEKTSLHCISYELNFEEDEKHPWRATLECQDTFYLNELVGRFDSLEEGQSGCFAHWTEIWSRMTLFCEPNLHASELNLFDIDGELI
jgi:hypothetical protein